MQIFGFQNPPTPHTPIAPFNHRPGLCTMPALRPISTTATVVRSCIRLKASGGEVACTPFLTASTSNTKCFGGVVCSVRTFTRLGRLPLQPPVLCGTLHRGPRVPAKDMASLYHRHMYSSGQRNAIYWQRLVLRLVR
mmetsp:Transcript_104361/g.176417  ORF Transcript_104361/g.176417 Transcript_104361/m.176417 type:complete len:137 (+) Transcript_104361:1055-1465(+)